MTTFVLLFVAAHDHAAHSTPANLKPVVLLPGMGKHSVPASKNSEAQKFFDQGLNLMYGFNRFEAKRSFEKAAELDPESELARWGVAMAQGPYLNMDMDGYDMKAYCVALAGLKHRYAVAARTRCENPKGDAAYIAAMRRLTIQYPDDLEAQTLLAEALMIPTRWAWFNAAGVPAPGMDEAIRVLENVMRRNPDHPGANHLYIHAVEMSKTPERAIPASQRLMGVVPGAGHLVHMPGHIWQRIGDYEMSASVNERAAEIDRDYFARTGATHTGYMGYYVHNLHFIAAARSMQGRGVDALVAAKPVGEAAQQMVAVMPDMADIFVPYPWFVMERFRRWDELLALPKPDSKLLVSTALWHWSRAMALAGQGKDASEEQAAFEKARLAVPAKRMWMNSSVAAVLSVASDVLKGRTAKTPALAVTAFQSAVAKQDALRYDEPPVWYYPVRESLGAALMRAGRHSEAERVFRQGLDETPRNGRLLFGLREALKAQGKDEAAHSVNREFEEAWRRADTKLSLDTM
ncbi:MAG: hypothetical protein SFV18_03315 [Bryobacteraceae bacterium]|nr:hypothetical protein [Bryobacteraceae bacterium]